MSEVLFLASNFWKCCLLLFLIVTYLAIPVESQNLGFDKTWRRWINQEEKNNQRKNNGPLPPCRGKGRHRKGRRCDPLLNRHKPSTDTTGYPPDKEKTEENVDQPMLDEMGESTQNPKLTLCATPTLTERHCLTFTNGRKSFNDYEYRIISRISFVHVKHGKWELCGDYNNTVACAILSSGMYIVLPDADTPDVILPDYKYMKATSFKSLDDDLNEDITMVDIFNEVTMMYKDLMLLSEQVLVLEKTLEENTQSLRSPGYRTYHHRKKRQIRKQREKT